MVPNKKEPINGKENDWNRKTDSNFASEIKNKSEYEQKQNNRKEDERNKENQ